jgi:hypothetical protein
MNNRRPEPCLCGDPECPRCFPHGWEEIDEDKLYEEQRQQEIDDGRMEARIREDAASAVDSS